MGVVYFILFLLLLPKNNYAAINPPHRFALNIFIIAPTIIFLADAFILMGLRALIIFVGAFIPPRSIFAEAKNKRKGTGSGKAANYYFSNNLIEKGGGNGWKNNGRRHNIFLAAKETQTAKELINGAAKNNYGGFFG